MPDAAPTLRPEIDAAPAQKDGETYYILYDRAGIAASRLLVSPMGLLIAGRLDGTSSILEICDSLSRETGDGVACSEVERVVDALEEALFLESPKFQDYQAQAARDFRAEPVRPAGSAGTAYQNDPVALAADLDKMLHEAPPPEESAAPADAFPRGIIVPHIDYMRGGAGYGQSYAFLASAPKPRTVIVIGTAHMPIRERFCLCEKDFDTPLGAVPVDRDLCRRLRQAMAGTTDLDRDVLAHRGEHSIELQAVWLRRLYGGGVSIVPLLAGSIGEFLEGDRDPEEAAADPALRRMAQFLADAVAGGDVMLMASADLAHVGPRFGDSREVTNGFLAEVEEVDRDYLEALAVDATSGLESLASHRDRHHVCGSAPIFTVGLALPSAKTRLLGYHQAVTPEMRQAVTFAAMTYE
ncbi:MAG: AmmeMemoRadiSam system protein B [Planctomycetaceae bacterium]|nr:AmmeMemoRadiSam system protein B [Planctomycetaceae bacterium]